MLKIIFEVLRILQIITKLLKTLKMSLEGLLSVGFSRNIFNLLKRCSFKIDTIS